jgi:hypothetical protein
MSCGVYVSLSRPRGLVVAKHLPVHDWKNGKIDILDPINISTGRYEPKANQRFLNQKLAADYATFFKIAVLPIDCVV